MNQGLIIAGITVALLSGGTFFVFNKGTQIGEARCEARHEAAAVALEKKLFEAADTMSQQSAEIEAYRSAQASMIEDLENAAMADPGACRLSDDARVRLKTRWPAP